MPVTYDYDVFEDSDIRVPQAPGELHRKIERLRGDHKKRTGKMPNKAKLIVELLFTHPKLRSL